MEVCSVSFEWVSSVGEVTLQYKSGNVFVQSAAVIFQERRGLAVGNFYIDHAWDTIWIKRTDVRVVEFNYAGIPKYYVFDKKKSG